MRVFIDKEQGYIASTKRGFSTKADSPLWMNPGVLVLQPREIGGTLHLTIIALNSELKGLNISSLP